MSYLKIFAIFGIVSAWLDKALADGKIDTDEILELVKSILTIAGVTAKINLK